MSSVNQEIDRRAAEWVAKRDLGELSPEDQAVFEAWLAADIRHLGAYGRAEAVLARLERLPGNAVSDLRDTAPSWSRRRFVWAGSAAAGLAVAGIVGAEFWLKPREEVYSTEIGQVREIVLSDSSVITLNTNSKVAVRFTRDLRDIHLLQGEALFDVAKNKKRPFIVHVGDMVVRAVGTSFTVSLLPQKPIQVLVKEGIVELNRATKSKALPVRANANMQVFAMQNAPIVAARVPQAQIQRDLAWQFGQIALDNQSLKDAATEFARYSDVRIDVAPTVANRTVTGLFISNDPIGFAKAAAAVLKLRVEVGDRVVKLSD